MSSMAALFSVCRISVANALTGLNLLVQDGKGFRPILGYFQVQRPLNALPTQAHAFTHGYFPRTLSRCCGPIRASGAPAPALF
jgi:hypothetical protein